MTNFINELKMIYYEVNGWILPSEEKQEVLNQNLINKALLVLLKREYEQENEEEANQMVSESLTYLTPLPYQEPMMTWKINEEPSQEKMEDFLMEIVEQTEQGQSLLQAKNQPLEPMSSEEMDQEELDGMTLSQVLMNLPTPGAEADHGDNYSGWTNPYVD